MKENNTHILEKKLTTDENIDEDLLLKSFEQNRHHRFKILLGLYKGQYFRLFISVMLFAVKHTPVWVLPIATANIINAATGFDENAMQTIIINTVIMAVLIVQNVLSNYFHTYCYSKVIRNVERRLRSSMVRKLQQLSITFHNEMQSGRLQSKIMRDVEQIENLSSQVFISVLSIIMNISGIPVLPCDYPCGGHNPHGIPQKDQSPQQDFPQGNGRDVGKGHGNGGAYPRYPRACP